MRHVAPSAGSISVVPAGSPAQWRWSGRKDSLHIYLEPASVARVGAEAFDLDPARLTLPPLAGLDLPHLRAAMWAVDAELTAGGARAEVALHAGCSDQSQFSRHFKRFVGVTPGQFRTPARIA
jgi:hypothetical protein